MLVDVDLFVENCCRVISIVLALFFLFFKGLSS